MSRLIEESRIQPLSYSTVSTRRSSVRSSAQQSRAIDQDAIVEWMAEKRVLSVALEGNIDQVRNITHTY